MRLLWLPLIAALLLGCSSGGGSAQVRDLQATIQALRATPTASPTPVPTEPPTPTPQLSFDLRGTVQAPNCGGGFNLTNAAVTIRDEHDAVIGATTTSANVAPFAGAPPKGASIVLDPDGTVSKRTHTLAELQAIAALTPQEQKAIQDYGAAVQLCIVQFAVTVPRAQFYQIRVGTHGAPTYSLDQMQAMGWKVSLSLGQ